MLNHISIMGRMTRDPDLRYTTKTEKPVTSFTLAVDRDGKDAGVDFIDCVAWDKTATFVKEHFKKGSMAIVSGTLQMRQWTDKNDNKRINAEVIARAVYFGESKKNEAPAKTSFGDLMDADEPLPWN